MGEDLGRRVHGGDPDALPPMELIVDMELGPLPEILGPAVSGELPALPPVRTSPIIEELLLRRELLKLRQGEERTQEDVAKALHWSAAKVIRLEGGKSPLKKVDLGGLLKYYDVDLEEQARLEDMRMRAKEPVWWDGYRQHLPDEYQTYLGYEMGATSLHATCDALVPELLQTPAYVQHMERSLGKPALARILSRVVEGRQQRLHGPADPLPQAYILDESVLCRWVGKSRDPALMPVQLDHIASMAEQDHVDVRVVPFSRGGYSEPPFTLLGFSNLEDFVYEKRQGPAKLTFDPERVDYRQIVFDNSLEAALPPADSQALIREHAANMRASLDQLPVSR